MLLIINTCIIINSKTSTKILVLRYMFNLGFSASPIPLAQNILKIDSTYFIVALFRVDYVTWNDHFNLIYK